MKYKNLPAEPVGWEPETTCNVLQSDYEEDTDEEDTDEEGETEIEASDQDSERSFRCIPKKKNLEKKSRKRDVVGIILQEDLFFFPEVY
jgi:hypothetical protein